MGDSREEGTLNIIVILLLSGSYAQLNISQENNNSLYSDKGFSSCSTQSIDNYLLLEEGWPYKTLYTPSSLHIF